MSNVLDNLETLTNKELHAECVRYGLPNVGINDANRNMFLKKLRKAINNPDTDGLDNLSNKELRAECVKWGLKNIPVTDSSRSVLIRRLRAAMAAGDANISNEIFTNNSSKTKSPKTTRRIVNSKDENNSTKVNKTVETGNTKKDIQNNKTQKISTKSANRTSMISPIVLHGYDEDDKSSVNTTTPTAFCRSPSLSKSGVFTTSYVQEIKPLKKQVEYQDEEDDDDVEFVDEYDAMDVDEADDEQLYEQYQLLQPPVQQECIPPSFRQTSSPYVNTSYERPPLHNSTSISSPMMTSSLEYEQQQMQQNFYKPIIKGNMTTSPIVSYQLNEVNQPIREHKLNRSTIYKTSTELFSQPEKPVHSSPNANRHVSFEKEIQKKKNSNSENNESFSIETIQAPKLYPNLNQLQREQQIYNEVRLEDVLDDSEETSQIELSSDDEATASSHYASFNQHQQPYIRPSRYSNKMSPSPRRPLVRSTTTTVDNNFLTPFRNNFNKLDQNYHIKQYFALFMAIILVAFIYAFFF